MGKIICKDKKAPLEVLSDVVEGRVDARSRQISDDVVLKVTLTL